MHTQLSGKTILIVWPGEIMPIAGGAMTRNWQLIDYLRRAGFRVELVTVPHEKKFAERIARMVDKVWMLEKPDTDRHVYVLPKKRRILKRITKAILSRLPFGNMILDKIRRRKESRQDRRDKQPRSILERRRHRRLEEYASNVANRCRPLAVIAVYAWTARVLDKIPEGVLKILDTIDVQHIRTELASASGGNLSDCECTRSEEQRELVRADVLLAIQADEMALLKEMCPDKQVLLVGHAPQILEDLSVSADSTTILFVGNRYDPNILGVSQFLQMAWPKIRCAVPEARFIICGLVCEALSPAPHGVQYEGMVLDLEPYYKSAAIAINPVPYGTGLPIKTVEALAQGKCVVTTSAGSLDFSNEKNCPVIVTPIESMAEKIIELLRNPEQRHPFEHAARKFAQQRLNSRNAFAELTNVLEQHAKTAGMK